jgi:hypothetical protein
MSIWIIVFLAVMIVVNYYYIEQFNRMNADVKVIKHHIEEMKEKKTF